MQLLQITPGIFLSILISANEVFKLAHIGPHVHRYRYTVSMMGQHHMISVGLYESAVNMLFKCSELFFVQHPCSLKAHESTKMRRTTS